MYVYTYMYEDPLLSSHRNFIKQFLFSQMAGDEEGSPAVFADVVNYVAIGIRDAEKARVNVELFKKCESGVPLELWKEAQKLGLIRKDVELFR